MAQRFLHTADIHLDSPLRGLAIDDEEMVTSLRQATRRAFIRLVDTALAERVALVLIAGDLYDGDWPDYQTGLFFIAQMARLREAGIKVSLVAGNHDARSVLTRSLRLPDNVHLFATHAPETHRYDELGIAVHGQSFEKKATRANLAVKFPAPVSGLLNIGLVHTSADGREGHETYAPCTVADLVAKGYDYWALGHVHRSEVLCEQPPIVFCGNLQGRHARETGAKGATLVTFAGHVIEAMEHRALDVVRWAVCELDVSQARNLDEVLERFTARVEVEREHADGRPLCLRVRVLGASPAHGALVQQRERFTNELRALASSAGGAGVWLEEVQLATRALPEAARTDLALDGLLRPTADLATDEALRARLLTDLDDLRRKLPAELKEGEGAIDLDPSAWLGRARELLTARLHAGEQP